MGTMTFNGVSTVDKGVIIQAPPVYEFPAKRMGTVQIQGRNGDIVLDKDSYNNVRREYSLASVIDTGDTFVNRVREIVDWLSTVSGYAELEDSYEPDYFRLAMFRTGGQLPNFFDKATVLNVTFECKPQRFLKTGKVEESITPGSWHLINNPTKYLALPEIKVTGTDVNLEFSTDNGATTDSEVTITGVVTDAIIDSDLQDCYDSSEYLNNRTTLVNGFPKLHPGDNWVFVSAGTTVSIKPRWWVL